MLIKTESYVTGFKIELGVEEAIRIVQKPEKLEHFRSELASMLNGAGVDPETGEQRDTALGLKARPFRNYPKQIEQSKKGNRVECPHCGRTFKGERGLAIHISRCPEAPDPDDGEEETIDELLDELEEK